MAHSQSTERRTIPSGLCQCGCGRATPRRRCSIPAKGAVAGEPHAYVRGHRPKAYVTVTCRECGHEFEKRDDTIKHWNGQCRRCTTVEAANRPELIARRREQARAQVIAQGGIPNARKITKENRAEIHANCVYRKRTPEERWAQKARTPHGAASHLWRGGVNAENRKRRSSLEYKLWREAVFARDDYTCQDCGKRGVYLHAHHIKPFSECPELIFDVSNGQTLCRPCHAKTDSYSWKQLNKLLAQKRASRQT